MNTSFKLKAISQLGLVALACSQLIEPPTSLASGGSGGGGGGGTGGGGGNPTPTPVPATVLVAYSNFGTPAPLATGNGYGLTGVQPSGFFDYQASRFTATASGVVTTIRLPIQQYVSGGNGQFSFNIYSDNSAFPGTLGALLGSYQGRCAQAPSTAISVINVSNGIRLVEGQSYWVEPVPSSQTRAAWGGNPLGVVDFFFYSDPYTSAYYSQEVQGAFEVYVKP